MAVEVSPLNILGGGAPPPTGFVDSLANTVAPNVGPLNIFSVNNLNWVITVLGWDLPFNNPVRFCSAYNMGQVLSAGGGLGMNITSQQTAVNPNYDVTTAIIPVRLLPGNGALNSPFYTAKKKFIQFTFWSMVAGQTAFGCGLMNLLDASGTGVAGNGNICHDAYVVRFDGLLMRHNSGAANVTLNNMGAFAQGDVIRMSLDQTNPAQATLIVTKNGAPLVTINDNAANRVMGPMFPMFYCTIVTATGGIEAKLFSCGLGL